MAELPEPRLATDVEHLDEQVRQRREVPLAERAYGIAAQRPAFGWSGCWSAASTRKGTDSYVACSIFRELRTPTQ